MEFIAKFLNTSYSVDYKGLNVERKIIPAAPKDATFACLRQRLPTVISTISEEYGCSKDTVRRDHQNMESWGKRYLQNTQQPYVLHARLEFLSRTSMETVLESKKPIEKIRATEVALKITQEQVRFGKELAIFEHKESLNVIQNLPMQMPWVGDPELKQALLNEEKRQREEYEARKAAQGALQKKQAEEQNADFN